LKAHSIGQVNVRAVIKLKNPPAKVKKDKFILTQTVTVIPRVVVTSERSIILRPNSSLPLSAIGMSPDTTLNSQRLYDAQYRCSGNHVFVKNKKLIVDSAALVGENVAVTLSLTSPRRNSALHRTKQYPLTQSSSLIVSIVEPTGLLLSESEFVLANAAFTQRLAVNADATIGSAADRPFWSSLSASSRARDTIAKQIAYSPTENLLCEHQNISIKVAILDELGRALHSMEQCKVESNDTTIVLPSQQIKVSTESGGGAMTATVYLNALQPGFATITFREKMVDSQSDGGGNLAKDLKNSPLFIFKNPDFLRTFLSIRVLSSAECNEQFGVMFDGGDEYSNLNVSSSHTQQTAAANVIASTLKAKVERKKAQQTVSLQSTKQGKARSNSMYAVIGAVILLIIICCSWSGLISSTQSSNRNELPPAAFNPYARMNDTINQSNQWQM